jgi:hypothetical protein
MVNNPFNYIQRINHMGRSEVRQYAKYLVIQNTQTLRKTFDIFSFLLIVVVFFPHLQAYCKLRKICHFYLK